MGQHYYTSDRPSYDQAKLLEQRKVQVATPQPLERRYGQEIGDEIAKHRTIKVDSGNWTDMLCGCAKSQKLSALYKEGSERLDRETNLVAIVKKLRHFEIILENSLLNSDQRKFDVAHAEKNVIDLDNDKPG